MPEVADKYLSDKVMYQAAAPKARVPKAEYRCKVKSPLLKGKGELSVPNTHPCRSLEGHEGDHLCICGKTWSTNPKENAK